MYPSPKTFAVEEDGGELMRVLLPKCLAVTGIEIASGLSKPRSVYPETQLKLKFHHQSAIDSIATSLD